MDIDSISNEISTISITTRITSSIFLSTTECDNSGSYDYVNFPDHVNFISRAYLQNTLSNTRHSSSNGEDICSTAGFDVIVKRMKDGHNIIKNVSNFLRQRAKIEIDYSIGLQKLVKGLDFSLEIGYMHSGLEAVRIATEKTVDEHMQSSKALTDCADRLTAFTDKQKSDRHGEESVVKNSSTKKIAAYKKVVDAKKTYYQKSQNSEKCEEEVNRIKSNKASVETKQWDKMIKANEKAKTECTTADGQYKDSIRQLEEARDQWQRDMQRFCEFCELQDISRIQKLQNELWNHCNVLSSTCTEDDSICEDIRTELEKIDADADIIEFVEKNQTGSIKPASIQYEAYSSMNDSQTSHTASPRLQTMRPGPATPNISSPNVTPSSATLAGLGARSLPFASSAPPSSVTTLSAKPPNKPASQVLFSKQTTSKI